MTGTQSSPAMPTQPMKKGTANTKWKNIGTGSTLLEAHMIPVVKGSTETHNPHIRMDSCMQ
eukprot:CAMPEP_0170645270 /NCGR_PEP_ID=MMETSP0224-20130122/42977_1 /TAXON_ID=285029 /ORGANISM="Togula jolla, Strain CCCM 725" /LENGTH=60 /DNA_ID=CAMNT_0010976449 /DNA_START=57 /DNA_END=239 /DNA_ORIENTATION=-